MEFIALYIERKIKIKWENIGQWLTLDKDYCMIVYIHLCWDAGKISRIMSA